MQNYVTVQEKAAEWNVSQRHIQNLCKKGEIKGAIKKVGAWFIPNDAPIPTKNTKSDAKHFHFVGTKKKIFEGSIILFTERGFETVSIRDIAEYVGITQSSLYNHFKSKQEILDTVYDFYCYYHQKDRPRFESLDPILLNGSLLDIMTFSCYAFDAEYLPKLTDITKIIIQRSSIDERARNITKSLLIDEGIRFVEEVINRAIKVGRIAPIDAHLMAVFINGIRIFTLHIWMVDPSPETNKKILEDELKLYECATKLLTDLKPPGKKGWNNILTK